MMPPENIRQCSGTLPRDLLTNLPENALDDILMRLPLREAVRTSILSKKWRCKWCRLPEVKLDQTLWVTTNDVKSSTIKFTDIMYHLLALHVGSITKFTLSIANLGDCPKIDSLIRFLSRNGIQHLVLQLSEDNPYKLPSSFFACLQMRHLRLHNCSIHHQPTFKGFNELVSLELYEVTISSELLESLISRSPLLVKLVLRTLSISDHIQVDAPQLRSFEFTGSIVLSLKKAPLLVKFSLLPTDVEEEPDLAKDLESFPALEHLHLNYISVKFLVAGFDDVPTKLSPPLNCLKRLCLSAICLDELLELKCALCLIRSSPYLQDIQMKIWCVASNHLVNPVPIDAVNEIPAGFSDVTLNHLRAVELEGITGTRPQMELIKLLLAKSPVLVRMVIHPKRGNESPETKVLAEMIKFRRASPEAEIDYKV